MRKKPLLLAVVVAVAGIFIAAGIYAGTTVQDVIEMNNPAYAKHTKGIVHFGHKKHVDDYGATCGECHHDDQGKPLELKEGDDVQSCLECHKETGKKPKGEKLKKKEKIMKYHKEALHANCIGCHKVFNKKNKLKKNDAKAAPTTCKKCHPKKKK